MSSFAKIKRLEFKDALKNELLTQEEFAERIGSNQSWISRLSSESTDYRCGKRFVRRVLKGFDGKYSFEELFFWCS